MQSHNARIGLVLFIVYLVIYGAFVLINALNPAIMDATPIAGVNLAILYGFGLIIIALVLSMVYGLLCKDENSSQDEEGNA